MTTRLAPGGGRHGRLLLDPDDGSAELAARLANLAWTWLSMRGRHRSHVDRIKAMQARGLVHDERYFARLAGR